VKGVDLTQALLDKGLAAKPGKARFGWCGALRRAMHAAPSFNGYPRGRLNLMTPRGPPVA
jgi:hypothetical protein